jgi:AcrR family transcriptional regulator
VTRAAIAEVGLALCEQQGIERLSMRQVAVRLDVTPMALYNHVGSKDDLVELVTEHVRSQVVVHEALPPRERLLDLVRQLVDLSTRFPRLIEAAGQDTSEGAVRLRLAVLRPLVELGLSPEQVRTAHNAVVLLILGTAAARRATEGQAVGRPRAHEEALVEHGDPSDQALAAALRELPVTTLERELTRAVDLVLAGLQSL